MTPPNPTPALARQLLGRGSIYALGRTFVVGAQVVVLPILTRMLAPEEYGIAALSFIVSSLLVSLGDLGLPHACARVLFDRGGDESARSLLGLLTVFGGAFVAVAHFTGPWWTGLLQDVSYSAPLTLAVWMAWPAMVRNAALLQLRARDRAFAHTWVSVTSALGGQLLGLLLLVVGPVGVERYVLGVAIGALLSAVLGVALVGIGRPVFRGSLLGDSLRYSLPTVPKSVSQTVISTGDRYVVERFVDLASVGRYQIGYRIGSIGLILSTEFSRAALPVLLGGVSTAKSAARRLLAFFAAGVGALVALVAPWVIPFIAPDDYRSPDLVAVVALVASAAIPAVVGSTATMTLVSAQRTTVLAWASPVGAALALGGAAVGVSVAGLPGAAAATLVAFSAQAWWLESAVRRIDPAAGLDRRDLGRLSLLTGSIVATSALPGDGVGAWARALLAIVIAVSVVRPLMARS